MSGKLYRVRYTDKWSALAQYSYIWTHWFYGLLPSYALKLNTLRWKEISVSQLDYMSHTIVRTPQKSERIAAFFLYSCYCFYVLLYVPLDIIVIKKNQLDAQLILSIFRQLLCVSGVSRRIIRMYNLMYKQLIPIILFRRLSVLLVGQAGQQTVI